MARQVEIKILSDLSPEAEAAETVNWALDGTEYEIDLTEKEASTLRKYLDKYSGASRRVTGRRGARKVTAARSGPDTNAVREWARSQGFTVSDRGRIPNEIMEKYLAAH